MTRLFALAGVALLGVGGCTNEAAKTFGNTYDECVLKNARGGAAQAELAVPSCRRHFELRSTTQAGVRAEAKRYLGAVNFSVINSDSSKIVTAVQIQVTFQDASGKLAGPFTWTFDTFIEPDRQVLLNGSLGDAPWEGPISATAVTVLREIPTSRQ